MSLASIWNDEWTMVASQEETTLPPRPPALDGLTIRVWHTVTAEWLEFVKSGWNQTEAAERLRDAHVLVLVDSVGDIQATCVLRARRDRWWLLETLRANKGNGTLMIRTAVRWLWEHTGGAFRIAFVWELGIGGALWSLVGRGWWRAVQRIHWGWMWSFPSEPTDPSEPQDQSKPCGWCPSDDTAPWLPKLKRWTTPVLLQGEGWSVVVSDSGARGAQAADGWVLTWTGTVPWSDVAKKAGWRRLWCHASEVPVPCLVTNGRWRWTGEVIVVGALNTRRGDIPPADLFVSAEI